MVCFVENGTINNSMRYAGSSDVDYECFKKASQYYCWCVHGTNTWYAFHTKYQFATGTIWYARYRVVWYSMANQGFKP